MFGIEIKKASFLCSVNDPSAAKIVPRPEIAIIGRSNVGKSTLINTVCHNNHLARVSATPGKTRQVNYFLINESFYLVDLPGYGYAKIARSEQKQWANMIESYLSGSQNLRHLLFLMDLRHEPTEDDKQMAYWLQFYRIPCTIIATKADKLPRSQRKILADKFSDSVGMTFRTPTIVFSSEERLGVNELEKRIGEILSV